MRAIERERLAAQRRQLDAWVSADEQRLADAPDDAAWRFVVEQGRRNRTRLDAAIAGQTPSAVVGQAEPSPQAHAAARAELARAEAAHAADNVVTFLDRGGPGDADRAARWLLRLDLERLDAHDPGQRDGLHWALDLLRARTEPQANAASRVKNAVAELLASLRDGP